MSYFRSFPDVLYRFGDEDQLTSFNNISLYVDIIDQIKDQSSFYTLFTIAEGDRPDNLSQQLYNTPELYWTFYLMNDNIREQGWPLTNREVVLKAQKDFPYTTLTTTEDILTKLDVGQTISGLSSAASGTIVNKRFDFGQIIVETSGTFLATEVVSSINSVGVVETATLTGVVAQYDSIHHYEDVDGNWTDVDPFIGVTGSLLAVTHTEYYIAQNDLLKEIRVIKPNVISNVNRSFKKSLKL